MKLDHIPLCKLSVSELNMRHGKKPPEISDILPSVRARGIIVPLIVRPTEGGDTPWTSLRIWRRRPMRSSPD
jgi:ParB family chromosome partitioning protein